MVFLQNICQILVLDLKQSHKMNWKVLSLLSSENLYRICVISSLKF